MKQPKREDYFSNGKPDGTLLTLGYINDLENYIEYLKEVQINKLILDT